MVVVVAAVGVVHLAETHISLKRGCTQVIFDVR